MPCLSLRLLICHLTIPSHFSIRKRLQSEIEFFTQELHVEQVSPIATGSKNLYQLARDLLPVAIPGEYEHTQA